LAWCHLRSPSNTKALRMKGAELTTHVLDCNELDVQGRMGSAQADGYDPAQAHCRETDIRANSWCRVVKLLVERDDVEADSKDDEGQTPVVGGSKKSQGDREADIFPPPLTSYRHVAIFTIILLIEYL
jgi:hypothetical protein